MTASIFCEGVFNWSRADCVSNPCGAGPDNVMPHQKSPNGRDGVRDNFDC